MKRPTVLWKLIATSAKCIFSPPRPPSLQCAVVGLKLGCCPDVPLHNGGRAASPTRALLRSLLLGAFAKLGKETISFVKTLWILCVCMSVRPHGTTRLSLGRSA